MSDFDDDDEYNGDDYGAAAEYDEGSQAYFDEEDEEDIEGEGEEGVEEEDEEGVEYGQDDEDVDYLINEQQREGVGRHLDEAEAGRAARAAHYDVFKEGNARKDVEILEQSEDVQQHGGTTSSTGKPKVTTRFMTKYERARLLGTRALQLSMQAPPTIDLRPNETDPLQIAQRELREGKLPLIVRRYLPDGSYEDWALDELIID